MERIRLGERIWLFGSFLRLYLFGWSLAMLVLGILSVANGLNWRAIAAISMVVPFQIVFAVVNDLATIEMDRRDPRKSGRPLVSGFVSPAAAKALVVAVVAVAFPVDAILLGFDPARSATLAIAFVTTAAYNIAGKRTHVPPLMDFLLGVGSAALVHYGALAVASTATATTFLVEVAVVIYITLDNGVHFSVRDIRSDLEYGAITTPIVFGVRPRENAPPYLPLGFWIYALCLQVLLTAVTLGPVLLWVSRDQIAWSAAIVALFFAVGCYVFIYPAIDAALSDSARYACAYLQSLCAFGSIAALGGAKHGGLPALGVFAILVVPLGAKSAIRTVRLSLRFPT